MVSHEVALNPQSHIYEDGDPVGSLCKDFAEQGGLAIGLGFLEDGDGAERRQRSTATL